jgi:hypothetical protein
LNWGCAGRIMCKVSDAARSPEGQWILPNRMDTVGLVTADALVLDLKKLEWVHLQASQIHRFALTYTNRSATANILLRKNGIDLQILPPRQKPSLRPFGVKQESTSEGRVVRHYLAHTTFNLYEGILRFAHCFMQDKGDYDRFFCAVGSGDKRTEKLKQESERRKRNKAERESNPLGDYYDEMCDGSGGNVYLGDGMWVGAGGGLHDEDGR